MSKSTLSYMGSRRLTKIAQHACEVQFKTSKGIRIDKQSYARYRGSEWILFSYLDGSNKYYCSVHVNHCSLSISVRIQIDLYQEDFLSGNEKRIQILNNCLFYDLNFAPAYAPKGVLSDVYHDDFYFVYDIRKEAANL